MPNKNYNNGRAFEYRVRDWLYERGAILVIRAAGSHTRVDLTAFFPHIVGRTLVDEVDSWDDNPLTMEVKVPSVWFVQCKRTGRLPGAEAEELKELASAAGAKPYHAHMGPGERGVELDLLT